MSVSHDFWCSAHSKQPCDCTFAFRGVRDRVESALRRAYCYGATTFALAQQDAARLVEHAEVVITREHEAIFGSYPVGASVLLSERLYEQIEKEIAETDAAGGAADGTSVRLFLDPKLPRTITRHEIFGHVARPASDFPRQLLVTPGVFAGQDTVALDFDSVKILPGDFLPKNEHATNGKYGELFDVDSPDSIKVCEHDECSNEDRRALMRMWVELEMHGFQKRSLVPVVLPPGKKQPWNADLLWRCPSCKLWSVKPVMRKLADRAREF